MDDGAATWRRTATVPRMVEQGDGTTAGGPGAPWRTLRDRVAHEVGAAGPLARGTAVVAAVGAAWWSGPVWATPALVLAAAAGGLVAVVDARTHRLPDAVVLPAWAGVVLLLAVAAVATGDGAGLVRALAGGATGFAAYAVLRLAYPPGLGFGDVKLAGLLGTPLGWLGWSALAVGLVLPFLLGGLWALVLVAVRRARRDTAVPFGPSMVLGALLAVALGGAIPGGAVPGS
ncbi:leader peptidase (prepilin peptidase)/N-methyltransferase [Cellulosimicrobium cellulans J34]|nr:leader peptidase (prepilin peptidase)/N-methyltransferase [Cellulosimicrobium cellulans J34]